MPSVARRDEDEEAAVRDEVDGVLGRLTRDWAVSRDDGAIGAATTGRTDDRRDAFDLDAAFEDTVATRSEHETRARFLHRSAEEQEVRATLESMRRATLDLTERDLRAARARRARNDDGTLDRVHLDRDAPEPYVMDGVYPPWYAKTYYKVVAVVHGDAGSFRGSGGGESVAESVSAPASSRVSFVSVYDGVTRYAPGTTVCHPSRPDHGGGLYVSRTIEGCLRRDRDLFPERSALLRAPRAVARARCWNPDRADDPVFYGSKLAFTCVHVDEILPYPTTWEAGDDDGSDGGTSRFGENDDRDVSVSPSASGGSPGIRARRRASSTKKKQTRFPARTESVSPGTGSAGGSPSPVSGKDAARLERRSDALLKAQAETVRLEEEARAMEIMRLMRKVAAGGLRDGDAGEGPAEPAPVASRRLGG